MLSQDERTPLHWAASGGHLDITEYLIRQKADVDATDDVRCFYLLFELSLIFLQLEIDVSAHYFVFLF